MGEGEPVYEFEVSAGVAGVWMLFSLLLFVAAAAGAGLLYALLGKSPFASAGSLLLWPVAFLAVLPLHELVHAAFVRVFGGRPRFGAGVRGGMPYLFVTDPGRRFGRDQFLAVALAPLVLIDVAALALLVWNPTWSWGAPALVSNTSGAVGDIWVAALLLRFPRRVQVEDRVLGFAVWPSPGHPAEEVRARAPRHRIALPAWVSAWVLSTLAIFAVLPSAAITLLRRSDPGALSTTLRLGPLFVASIRRRPGGHLDAGPIAGQINFGALFLLAALVAGLLVLGWALMRRWRRRRSYR
jgi:Putative zincin peptidase